MHSSYDLPDQGYQFCKQGILGRNKLKMKLSVATFFVIGKVCKQKAIHVKNEAKVS